MRHGLRQFLAWSGFAIMAFLFASTISSNTGQNFDYGQLVQMDVAPAPSVSTPSIETAGLSAPAPDMIADFATDIISTGDPFYDDHHREMYAALQDNQYHTGDGLPDEESSRFTGAWPSASSDASKPFANLYVARGARTGRFSGADF